MYPGGAVADEAGLVHTPLSANSDVSPATQEIYDGETKRILNVNVT